MINNLEKLYLPDVGQLFIRYSLSLLLETKRLESLVGRQRPDLRENLKKTLRKITDGKKVGKNFLGVKITFVFFFSIIRDIGSSGGLTSSLMVFGLVTTFKNDPQSHKKLILTIFC